jgi:Fur family transcriptional regulator, ferric uptake regulator
MRPGYHVGMSKADPNREALRSAGLRVTIARLELLRKLEQAPGPVSMDDVVRLCRDSAGDPATIYRNLQALTEAGLLHSVRGVGKREMYELSRRAGDHHAHLSCTNCGRVTCVEVEAPAFNQSDSDSKGWSVREVTVTLWGLCPDCDA